MTTNMHILRQTIGRLPVLGPIAKQLYRAVAPGSASQFSSSRYWEQRYAHGGNSGAGSYGRLAEFKAATLNGFVEDRGIQSVVEFGSGDGAQLELARYPAYTGIDVSANAIRQCQARFKNDPSKRFLLASSPEADRTSADLALSLDVIYHLVEDAIYEQYMTRLVAAADNFVGIYSSNVAKQSPATHVRHRVFMDWMKTRAPTWKLIQKIENPFPEDPQNPDETSWADFYFFGKQ